LTTLTAGGPASRWRLWAFVPLLALVAVVAGFTATGSSVIDLLGRTPPSPDEFDIRRVELRPGEVRIRVTNPQQADLTVGQVTVDDAIVPFSVEGDATLDRLQSATIVVPYDWVQDEPLAVGVTSSTGIQTTHELAAAVETPEPSAKGFFGFGLIGFLVGVVPVALGLLWLPSLRRARPDWLAAFMALTAGLLTFLAIEALSEALELQAALPSALGGAGIVLLGFALSYLTLTFLSRALAALATLVAVGIGLHNFGEGLAIGTSFAFGELALGTFLIVGFMIHNVTEGLGIATAAAEERRVSWRRLVLLALVAGAPAIFGTWLGGYVRNDVLGVLFFAAAAGAAFEVVVEVVRWLRSRAPGGLTSGYALGGFLAGITIMYATGLLAG
jgi:zinc transporter ZupT